MSTAYISLGSNLDQPKDQLDIAAQAIKALPQSQWKICSRYYVTKPWGIVEQPPFMNAVCAIETQLPATDLMKALLQIEADQGRVRTFRNAPRVIDCDLLLYGDAIIESDRLIVPHPRLHERLFVLAPLQEIAPELMLPTGESVTDLVRQCDQTDIIEILPHQQEQYCHA